MRASVLDVGAYVIVGAFALSFLTLFAVTVGWRALAITLFVSALLSWAFVRVVDSLTRRRQ